VNKEMQEKKKKQRKRREMYELLGGCSIRRRRTCSLEGNCLQRQVFSFFSLVSFYMYTYIDSFLSLSLSLSPSVLYFLEQSTSV
jgi:hypothetical protein